MGTICQKINRELPLHCSCSPPFWSSLVTYVRRDLAQRITKGLLKYAFATDYAVLSDKKLPLISWHLSGCHIDLGKPSTPAPTYSTNFQKQNVNIFSKIYLLGGAVCFLDWVMKQHLFWMEKQISTSLQPLLLPWEDRHSSHKLYPRLSLEVSWGSPLLKILAVTTKMELWCSVFLNFILYNLVWNTLPRMVAKYRTDMSDLSATVSQMRLSSSLSVLQNGIKRFSFKSPMKDSSSREWLKLLEVWHFARLWLGFEKKAPHVCLSEGLFTMFSLIHEHTQRRQAQEGDLAWAQDPQWLGLQCYLNSVWLVYCSFTGAADDKLTYICCYLEVFVWIQGVIFFAQGCIKHVWTFHFRR